MIKYIFSICLITVTISGYSQYIKESQILATANDLYKSGKPFELLHFFERNHYFRSRNQAELYRLAALSCFLIGKKDTAYYYIDEMLKKDPLYIEHPSENDLPEMKFALNQYILKSRITIGISYGYVFTRYDVFNLFDYNKVYDNDKQIIISDGVKYFNSFSYGFPVEYRIFKNITINYDLSTITVKSPNYKFNKISIKGYLKYFFFANKTLQPYLLVGFSKDRYNFYVNFLNINGYIGEDKNVGGNIFECFDFAGTTTNSKELASVRWKPTSFIIGAGIQEALLGYNFCLQAYWNVAKQFTETPLIKPSSILQQNFVNTLEYKKVNLLRQKFEGGINFTIYYRFNFPFFHKAYKKEKTF
jgi:hypothetical protein